MAAALCRSPSKLGILGGAFDPIHNVHLFIAESAPVARNLDRILFIPTGVAHHKPTRKLAPAEDRCQMVARAIAGNPAFEISRLEIDREGPSYSVDTLATLEAQYPSSELFFM